MRTNLSAARNAGAVFGCLALAGCASSGPLDLQEIRPNWANASTSSSVESLVETKPQADVDPLDQSSGLGDYVAHALGKSAELEAAWQRWVAARERVPQAAGMPDPRLTYGYFFGEVETRVGAQQHQVMIGQMIPWPGKLDLRGKAAAKAAEATYMQALGVRQSVVFDVRKAYYELFALGRTIDLTKKNVELLKQVEQVVRRKYEVAQAGYQDLIRVQLEIEKINDRVRMLEDRRKPLTAGLNAALNRPSDAPVAWPADLSDEQVAVDDLKLRTLLDENNPGLAALDRMTERERINTALAKKNNFPDVTVSLMYAAVNERAGLSLPENGDDVVLGSVSVNLPIWREKYKAAEREAIARRLATAGQRADRENDLAAMLESALFAHRDAGQRAKLHLQTLIPMATESLDAAMSGFEAGKASFLDILDAERGLLEMQTAYERARVERAIGLATIEMLVGRDLPHKAAVEMDIEKENSR